MKKQNTLSLAASRRALFKKKSRRQLYADLRNLVQFETIAKQFKLPPVRRAPPRATKPNAAASNGPTPDVCELKPLAAPREYPVNGANHHPSSVLVVVDQRISMFYGSKRQMKSVVAVEAAACVAWGAWLQESRIGAVVFNDKQTVSLAPQLGRLHLMLVLHDLLNQNHRLSNSLGRTPNPRMLNRALRQVEALATKDSFVVLITDASGHDEETRGLLTGISRQNDLAVVLVFDPRQTTLSHKGSFIADRNAPPERDLARSFLVPNGIATIPLSTGENVPRQIYKAFRKLCLRRAAEAQAAENIRRILPVEIAPFTKERSIEPIPLQKHALVSETPVPLPPPAQQPLCA